MKKKKIDFIIVTDSKYYRYRITKSMLAEFEKWDRLYNRDDCLPVKGCDKFDKYKIK